MHTPRIVVILSSIGLLSSCATVVRGTTEDVLINYSPADARVETSFGLVCTGSPCTVKVKRKEAFHIKASKPGYQSQTVQVNTKVSGKGVAGAAGNVIAGGVIGIGVDAVSGATKDHYPNPVNIRLYKNGETAPSTTIAPESDKQKSTPTS